MPLLQVLLRLNRANPATVALPRIENAQKAGFGRSPTKGRINTSSALMTMVEACNTDLGLGLFPEDVAAIAAVLNREHYHFSK